MKNEWWFIHSNGSGVCDDVHSFSRAVLSHSFVLSLPTTVRGFDLNFRVCILGTHVLEYMTSFNLVLVTNPGL